MKLLAVKVDEPAEFRGASVALGNFDGLHPGHRAVLDAARRVAQADSHPLGLVTFEPPPRRFFAPEAPPFRIMTPLQRRKELERLGVDVCYLVPFDALLAGMTDKDFVGRVLAGTLGVRAVAVGSDYRFGRGRMGDAASLQRFGSACGINTQVVPEVQASGRRASSTALREMFAAGNVSGAADILGRPWIVDGLVEHGEKRGRELGFPTANLRLGELLHPAFGVYAVFARPQNADWMPGVASFGRTPTTGLRDPLLEVVLFGFSGDLYGLRLEVAFVEWLRGEERFESLPALVEQMHRDAARARAMLANRSPPQ